jgi:FAD-linked sulfhydryl oxidase
MMVATPPFVALLLCAWVVMTAAAASAADAPHHESVCVEADDGPSCVTTDGTAAEAGGVVPSPLLPPGHISPGEHRLSNYGGSDKGWRQLLGRRSWFLLHSLAAKFPEYPSKTDRDAMQNFIAAMGQLYPCPHCRKHLQEHLRDRGQIAPVALQTRTNLTVWVCELHNIVNRDLGKPLFDCAPLALDLMYLKDCGECSLKPEDIGDDGEASHCDGGPWDAALYAAFPRLLQSTPTRTALIKAKQKASAIELLVRLKVIKTHQRDALESKLSGPRGDALLKKVRAALSTAKAALKKALPIEELL